MTTRRIYLARHGDAAYTHSEGGVVDVDSGLTDRGITEAIAMRGLLESVPIDLAIATGLRRTVQTAEVVVGERGLSIEILPGLSEAEVGHFESFEPTDESQAVFTTTFDHADAPGARFLHGETYAAISDRVAVEWHGLLARNDWKCAFVVGHGIINRAILADSLEAGPAVYKRIEQDSGCLNVLDVAGSGADAHVVCARLINLTPYNLTKAGMIDSTLELLWRRLSGR